MRGIVYISGPITLGDREDNIKRALNAGEKVWALGFAPYIPQLSYYYNDVYPHTWEEWLELDETIIKSCCAVIRIPGESKGADREVEFAIQEMIPVFFNHTDFKIWSGPAYFD